MLTEAMNNMVISCPIKLIPWCSLSSCSSHLGMSSATQAHHLPAFLRFSYIYAIPSTQKIVPSPFCLVSIELLYFDLNVFASKKGYISLLKSKLPPTLWFKTIILFHETLGQPCGLSSSAWLLGSRMWFQLSRWWTWERWFRIHLSGTRGFHLTQRSPEG